MTEDVTGPNGESSFVPAPEDDAATCEETSTEHLLVCPFGRYEVVVSLSDEGEFLGVLEVRLSKDFRSVQQRMSKSGHHEVDHLYEE